MSTLLRAALAAATLSGCLISGIGAASAQSSEGVYVGPHGQFGVYLDDNSRRDNRNRPEARDPRWPTYGDWYADPNRYREYNRANWNRRACYPVSRYAYDRRGRDVRVVATMCYRRDGTKYTVPGSEHVVR